MTSSRLQGLEILRNQKQCCTMKHFSRGHLRRIENFPLVILFFLICSNFLKISILLITFLCLYLLHPVGDMNYIILCHGVLNPLQMYVWPQPIHLKHLKLDCWCSKMMVFCLMFSQREVDRTPLFFQLISPWFSFRSNFESTKNHIQARCIGYFGRQFHSGKLF